MDTSQNGQLIASVSARGDETVKVSSLESGALLKTLRFQERKLFVGLVDTEVVPLFLPLGMDGSEGCIQRLAGHQDMVLILSPHDHLE